MSLTYTPHTHTTHTLLLLLLPSLPARVEGELFLTVHLGRKWGVSCAIRGGHFISIFAA